MRFLARDKLVSNKGSACSPRGGAGRQVGVSLVELLLVVVAVGMLVALMGSIPNSVGLISRSKHQSLAREIALKQIEDKRATAYANLTPTAPTGDPFTDSRLSLLPGGSGKITIADCGSICTNNEHIKQLTVEVDWKDGGKSQSVQIKSMIAEGGLNQ